MEKTKTNFRDLITRDLAQKKSEASTYGYLRLPKDVKVFTPPLEGRVKLDFLPYIVTSEFHPDRDPESGKAMPGTLWWKRPFKIHRNIGTGSESETVVCPTSIGLKCPICEYRAKKIREKADNEIIKALKPSNRVLYIVMPVDEEKYEERPYIFDISYAMFEKKLNVYLEEDDSYRIFPDLKEGLTLKIRFEERQIPGSQPFPEVIHISFLERNHQYDEKILKEIPNLDEILKVLSYDELSAKFFEMEDFENPGSDKLEESQEEEQKEENRTESFHNKFIINKPSVKKDEKVEKEIDDEDEDRKEASSDENKVVKTTLRLRREQPKASEQTEKTKSKDKCPFGHVFGKDIAEYKECNDCDLWDDCDDEASRK